MHGESEKKEPVAEATTNNSDTASIEKTAGVAKIEGVTLAWSKVGLWTAWAGIMLLAVAVSLDSQTIYSYQPMATSTFGAHSLLATIGTVQNIMYAVTKPPVAKIADVFGYISLSKSYDIAVAYWRCIVVLKLSPSPSSCSLLVLSLRPLRRT